MVKLYYHLYKVAKVSPENLRRGSRTVVKAANLPLVDSQLLAGRPHDNDANEMRKYAEQHPEKSLRKTRSWKQVG